MLDTIADGSYGECPYAEVAKKLEKISQNNKVWSTRKSYTGRNTFAVQSSHNSVADDLCEDMAQMRTELRLVLKHVVGGAEKVNAVNYLSKPPPLNDEYYYEEDFYAVNDQTRGFQPNAQGSNQENSCQGQGNQGRNYGNYNREVIMPEMGITTVTTTSTRVTMVTKIV